MSCSEVFPIPKYDWSKATRPRCLACGGLLFLNGMWHGRSKSLYKMVVGGSPENIIYPGQPSEFEIQCMIYTELNGKGMDVRGEVNTCGNLSRFDLVVFVEFKPKLIIEVKKKTKSHKYRGEQVRKYSSHKLPVVVIAGMDHALRFVKNFFRKYPDLRWAEKPQPEWSI